jgi:hypothetical protein
MLPCYLLDLAVIVMSSIGAASAYFALCAIRGVRAVDPALLWKFLLWKAGRAFFFSLLLFSDMWKTLGTPLQGSYMFLFVMSTAWRASFPSQILLECICYHCTGVDLQRFLAALGKS